jgi:hypothetical protein
MASTIIHLAIANRVNKKIKVENEKDYYLGAIAPDISKLIGETKEKSHFLINTINETPNINLFIKRYPTFKYNSFNLGYFTHLIADKKWYEDFEQKIILKDSIRLLDGTVVKATPEEIERLLYSDYTNLNKLIIDEYELSLSLFYENFIPPKTNLQEVPIDQLDIVINKAGIIIENSKEDKNYTLDFEAIKKYIEETANIILEELKRY